LLRHGAAVRQPAGFGSEWDTLYFNTLKTKINQNYVPKVYLCLTVKIMNHHYKKQMVNAAQGNNLFNRENNAKHINTSGPGSSVGIATKLWAGQSGDRIPVGARFSAPVQTGPGAHPSSCTMGTGSFPGVKCGRGVTLTTHSLLVPWSWKSRAIPLPTLWATPGL
jgi:hypothetical protein